MESTKFKSALINSLASVLPFFVLKKALPDRFILYGHVVSDKDHPVSRYYQYPSLREFDKLINDLKRSGFDFVSLVDFVKDDMKKKILITFDDGFRSIHDDLHPFMRERNLPYAIFILSDPFSNPGFFISSVKPDHNDAGTRTFLSVPEVMTLKDSGVHIGFHTRSHLKIQSNHSISDKEIRNELTIPDELREIFSTPLTFAYPYLAPSDYSRFDNHMRTEGGYQYFFDTKGFIANDGDHFFRVSIDAEKGLKAKNKTRVVIKRQLTLSLLKKMRLWK